MLLDAADKRKFDAKLQALTSLLTKHQSSSKRLHDVGVIDATKHYVTTRCTCFIISNNSLNSGSSKQTC